MSQKNTPDSTASGKWLASDFGIALGLFIAALLLAFSIMKTQAFLDDDAYIFLRYARNLLEFGQFVYNEGEFSYGFTSMLWLLLISGISAVTGCSVMSSLQTVSVLSFGSMIVLMYIVCLGLTSRRIASLAGAVLLMLLPVSVEYSLSGMETPLVACGLLAVIALVNSKKSRSALTIGMATGCLVWIRPELVLVFPVWLAVRLMKDLRLRLSIGIENSEAQQAGNLWRDLIRSTAGFALCAVPYFGFWLIMNNRLMPMTYMGKLLTANPDWPDMNYIDRIPAGIRIFMRGWGNLVTQERVGTAILLILAAGMIWGIPVFLQIKRKMFPGLAFPVLISATILSAYWFSYPVNNLRYVFWMLPVSLMIFVATYSECVNLAESVMIERQFRLLRRIFRIVLPVALFAAIVIESLALVNWRSTQRPDYSDDIIVSNMAWFEQHIPENQTVAFDMIGRFSYLLNRSVFDLGGLIHPEIWPALAARRNPDIALDILLENRVFYLVSYSRHILWAHLPQKVPHRLELIDSRSDSEGGIIAIFRILTEPLEARQTAHPKAPGILMQTR